MFTSPLLCAISYLKVDILVLALAIPHSTINPVLIRLLRSVYIKYLIVLQQNYSSIVNLPDSLHISIVPLVYVSLPFFDSPLFFYINNFNHHPYHWAHTPLSLNTLSQALKVPNAHTYLHISSDPLSSFHHWNPLSVPVLTSKLPQFEGSPHKLGLTFTSTVFFSFWALSCSPALLYIVINWVCPSPPLSSLYSLATLSLSSLSLFPSHLFLYIIEPCLHLASVLPQDTTSIHTSSPRKGPSSRCQPHKRIHTSTSHILSSFQTPTLLKVSPLIFNY